MNIKPSHTFIDMINIDNYDASSKLNKKNNINKPDEPNPATIRKELEDVCNDKIKFSKQISDIYEEVNNNNLKRKKDIEALSAMKEAINLLPKSEISAIAKPDYDKDDLINLLCGKNAPEDNEKPELIKARALFDISAHNKLSAPGRAYFNKEKVISHSTALVAGVAAAAGRYLSSRWLDPDMDKMDSAGISAGAALISSWAVNRLLNIYVERAEHKTKLGDEKNSAIFKCAQSLANNRLKGMELFETKHIAPNEFKLAPS